MFDTPVPIVSAFGGDETIGDLILDGAHVSQDQQDRFNLMVKVINAVNSIDLSGSTGGAKIDFGTINLTGNAEQAGQFSFDTSQLGSAINEILNSPLLQEVKSDLQDLAADAGLTSTEGFQFPLLTDPSSVIFGMLTGQTKDMFTFSTGREHFELSAGVGFGIPDVLGIFLNAGMVFDADLTMGYDTAGLTKFIQDSRPQPGRFAARFLFRQQHRHHRSVGAECPQSAQNGIVSVGFSRYTSQRGGDTDRRFIWQHRCGTGRHRQLGSCSPG